MNNLRLAFVIDAVDRASYVVRKVMKTVDGIMEPVGRVRAAFSAVSGVAMSALGKVASLGAAGGAAFYGFKRLADAVDNIGDRSAELGITTQALQRMGYAAQLSGSNQEQLGQALQFLSQNMVEAVSGSKEMQAWFSRVGLTAQQLATMNVQQVLERFADVFKRVGDSSQASAAKIAFARATMGRGGTAVIQMLNGGSAAMRAAYLEADRLGVVLSTDTVKAMSEFNDSWDRMKLTAFGAIATALKPAASVLEDLLGRFTEWIAANRELIGVRVEAFVKRVADALPGFLDGVERVAGAVGRFVEQADKVAGILGGWPNVMAVLVGLMGVELVASVVSLASSLGVLSAAAWANPMTWMLAVVMALVAAVPLLILHFDTVAAKLRQLRDAMPAWMVRAFEGSFVGRLAEQITGGDKAEYQDGRLDRRGAAIVPTRTAQEAQEQALRDAGFGARTRVTVGGEIGIRVDAAGRIKDVRNDVKGPFEFDAYNGAVMAGG